MVRISKVTLTSALAAASLFPSTVSAFSRATKGAGLLKSPYDAYLQSHKKRFVRRVRHCKDGENATTATAEPSAIADQAAAPTTLPLFAVASTTVLEKTVDEYITVTVAPEATPAASSTVTARYNATAAKKNETGAASHASYKCPAGSKYAAFEDDFAKFDTKKWTREAGEANSSVFGKDGLKMILSEEEQNIVYQSTARWIVPVTMSVSMKSTDAPGVIHCAIFKNEDASDEIDLELIQSGVDLPLWKDGKRLEFGRDVTGQIAEGIANRSSWQYTNPAAVPFKAVHEYTVNWNTTTLDWKTDGKPLLNVHRINGSKAWPSEPLHIRMGPWIAGEWAGKANWTAFPNPVQQVTRLTVNGCMVE